jgi:regulator of sigma E protease
MIDIVVNIFSFVAIISVIAFVHEYGHYKVAKLSGVRIEVFSIGFGPEIFGWSDKSGTRWKISLFPLGGYVKMFGDSNAASVPDSGKLSTLTQDEKDYAFHTKPLAIKSAIVAAGPVANFLFAIIILAPIFFIYGKPYSEARVNLVEPGSVAEREGLIVDDLITEIDGDVIDDFEDLRKIVSINSNTVLDFTIIRAGHEIHKMITPEAKEREDAFGNKVKIGSIGIASSTISYKKFGLLASFNQAVKETYSMSALTLKSVGQMIVGKRGTEDLGGPIRIAKYSGQSVKQGINVVFWFMAVLSINLGLINLFPVPILDGGHLVYYAIEAIRGKPMAERFQQIGFRLGFALIGMLMIFSTFNDIKNLFITK